MVLISYKNKSQSYKQLLRRGINNLPTQIRWGLVDTPYSPYQDVWNKPAKVRNATNKKTMLEILDANNIPTLEWTTDKETAKENTPIYCRTELCSSKGKGIKRAETPEEVITAPLYTKALDGYEEYRIHVMKGEVFYAQKKISRHENARTTIKNLVEYYFSKRDITRLHPQLYEIPKKTINALGLDFGAVDVMKKGNDLRVLEVNTAPGLDNSTADAYANAFKKHHQRIRIS